MSFIRRGLIALIAAAVLVVGFSALPATAGDGYWSVSGCSGPVYQSRLDIYWLGTPGSGAFYWHHNYGSGAPWAGQAFYVSGAIHARFAAGGYECGASGAPTAEVRSCSSTYGSNPIIQAQRFENGRYIVRANGEVWYQHGVITTSCGEA